MEMFGFIAFIVWMVVLIVLSFATDHLLARIFSAGAHRYFVGLGVIVHELSHYIACKLTLTKVTEVVFFEESGGHVTHEKRNPVITLFISMAPLVGCSLFILFLAWLFRMVGVEFNSVAPDLNDATFVESLWAMMRVAGQTIWDNFALMSMVTIFFLIFLYLVGSVAATIAPSGVDLKHAAIGLVLFAVIGALAIYIHPLSYLPGVEKDTPIMDAILVHEEYGLINAIGIGLIGIFLILAFLIPIAILKRR